MMQLDSAIGDCGIAVFSQKLNAYYDISNQYCTEIKIAKKKKDYIAGYQGCNCNKFIECLVIRLKSAEQEFQRHFVQIVKGQQLMKTDIENQVKNNLILSYQNMILKSKESHYMHIINEAKKDNMRFEQKFKDYRRAFRAFDINFDGTIEFHEFI